MSAPDEISRLANMILPNNEAIRREIVRLSTSNASLKESYQRAVGFLAAVALHGGGEIRIPEEYVKQAENHTMTIAFKRDNENGDLVFSAEIEPTEEEQSAMDEVAND